MCLDSNKIMEFRKYFFRYKVKPGVERVQALTDISRSALCCHSNETRAPIANPLNNAQLEGTSYHSPTYILVCAVVCECGEGQTDTQTAVTTFSPRLFTKKYYIQQTTVLCS